MSSTTEKRDGRQSATDRQTLEEIRRGLCKEVAGFEKEIQARREQMQGKRAQLNAINRHLGYDED